MLQHFISFDKLIGTKLIKILYFIGLALILISGVLAVFGGFGAMRFGFLKGVGAIIMALFGTALGLVFWRFLCEIYMLFFRMSDDLRDIKNHQLGRPANETDV